jgi:hypothetical protein
VVDHPFAVAIGNGLTEEDQIRQLTVDRDDGSVRRRHQYEFRADVIADELTQSFRFGGFRFDG